MNMLDVVRVVVVYYAINDKSGDVLLIDIVMILVST